MPDEAKQVSIEDALRRLLAEIAFNDYRDRSRQRLTNNTAYAEAATLLELSDLLHCGPQSKRHGT